MGHTQRIDRPTKCRYASSSRTPSVFIQHQPLVPDRLPHVCGVLAFWCYEPLHPLQDIDTCDYESMTNHAFGKLVGKDECDCDAMSHHKWTLDPIDLWIKHT